MSTTYRVWEPDQYGDEGPDEDDKKAIEIPGEDDEFHREWAATEYREKSRDDWESPDEYEVVVQSPDGTCWLVDTHREMSPSYSASVREMVPAKDVTP